MLNLARVPLWSTLDKPHSRLRRDRAVGVREIEIATVHHVRERFGRAQPGVAGGLYAVLVRTLRSCSDGKFDSARRASATSCRVQAHHFARWHDFLPPV